MCRSHLAGSLHRRGMARSELGDIISAEADARALVAWDRPTGASRVGIDSRPLRPRRAGGSGRAQRLGYLGS